METTATKHIIFKDPSELRLHKLQRHIPEPDRKSPEWIAFIDSIHAGGILHPLLITTDGQVMDGGWRWRAAKQLEMDEVPCLIRPESEAAVIIAESLLHRKQMTRGAAVYLALALLPDFVASAEARRLANLKRGHKTREIPLKSPMSSNSTSEESVSELCARWGVGKDTFHRARQVHDIFAHKPELKKEWEPRLLNGEKNLWNVLSAIGGAGADQSRREQGVIESQLELFDETFSKLQTGAKAWKKFKPEQREAVLQQWRKTAAAMPPDMREAMIEALEEVNS